MPNSELKIEPLGRSSTICMQLTRPARAELPLSGASACTNDASVAAFDLRALPS